MSVNDLQKAVEAILFAAGETVDIKGISAAIDQDPDTVVKIVEDLADKYRTDNRGIDIIRVGEGYQMCTNRLYYDYIKKLYQAPKKKVLSTTLLETLAIIAYKQPVTKAQIEEIRGVNADHAVNKLVEYDLVCEKGRLDVPGRPILFGNTDEFLRYFGFRGTEAMPPVPEITEQMRLDAERETE